MAKPAHWQSIARRWHLVGPPLRPGNADITLFEEIIRRRASDLARPLRGLILGVTPELANLDWPADTELKALDGSGEMVSAVWDRSRGQAIVGSWTATPIETDSQDVIVCDGGVGLLSYPDGQSELLREMVRLLAPGGVFAARLFAPGNCPDSMEQLQADLERGAVPSLDMLKFRLWGLLQADVASGVRPAEVVSTIERFVGDAATLSRRFGWPAAHVETLELHRHNDARYCLSNADTLGWLAGPVPGLEMLETRYPDHAVGAGCPVVSFRHTPATG